jgi:hypothetical protein
VKTSIVTVDGADTWTTKVTGVPLDGLGYGTAITGSNGAIGVFVSVTVGVALKVEVAL